MDLYEKLKKIFEDGESHSIDDLVRYLRTKTKMTRKNILLLLDALYDLEKKGKIYYDEAKGYKWVGKDFPYNYGTLKITKRSKRYYIMLNSKSKIMLKTRNVDSFDANVGDFVFVEELSTSTSKSYSQEKAGKIVRVVRKNEWCYDENYSISTVIHKKYSKNYYYIVHNDIEIPIPFKNLQGAFDNDIVSVNINYNGDQQTARVLSVEKRKTDEKVFIWTNKRFKSLENENAIGIVNDIDVKKFEEGQKVLAHYKYNTRNNLFILSDIKLIEKNSVNDEIVLFALNHGVQKDFPANIEKDAEKLHITVKMREDRRDERDRVTFTIDPTYAKDLDDAVSVKKINSDKYELKVDIVDTTPFVPFGSALFEESMRRGNSYYLADLVFPELPSYLSNNLCSLNPGEDKLTRTFMIQVDSSGKILDYEIYNSIIKSKMKMNYDGANDFLEKGILHDGYCNFRKELLDMNDLSDILQKRRLDRGFLILDTPKLNFTVSADGTPVGVFEEHRGAANTLIENFMILSGEVASDFAYWNEIPFVYRNHECPDLNRLFQATKELPKSAHRLNSLKNIKDPKNFQRYMKSLMKNATADEYQYYSNILLSAFQLAYYSDVPVGHWAMALLRYAHVTSTMRRGADQLNHLALDEFLTKRHGGEYMDLLRQYIHEIGPHLSTTQQDADRLERDVVWFLLNCYAKSHNGELLEATIEFISPRGLYLKTENNIPGFIPFSKGLVYDANKNIVKNKSVVYQVGDKVLIRVVPYKAVKNALLFEMNSKNSYKKVLRKENEK